MTRLFEMLLQEASKARFINQIWNKLEDNPENVMNMTRYKANLLPDADTIIKWVDSGAANSFLQKSNFNWQNFVAGKNDAKGVPLYVELLNAYFDYKNAGGSRKEKHEYIKKNPYEVFKQSGLKVISSGEADPSADMMLLPELENDKFIFVVPLTYEACKFMDSFRCGGQGAKWCLGYEDTDKYYQDYIDKGYFFILAFSKQQTPAENELKYMIELLKYGGSKAWLQNDDRKKTIPEHKYREVFGWNYDKMFEVFNTAVLSWEGNVYRDAADGERLFVDPNEGFDISGGNYEFEDYQFAVRECKKFILNGGGRHYDELDLTAEINFLGQHYKDVRPLFKVRNGDFKHVDLTVKNGWIPPRIVFDYDAYVERLDVSSHVFDNSEIEGNCIQHIFVDGREIDW